MAPLLFPTCGLTEKQVEFITQVYEALRPAHPDAEFDFDYKPPFSNYDGISGCYSGFDCGPVIRMENNPSAKYLCFIDAYWNDTRPVHQSSGGDGDFQTWGISLLCGNYGHVLIRPETTLDKIRELIHHSKIDIEDDRSFSKEFYILANREDCARRLLGPGLRQTIAGLRLTDFTIEVIDNILIVGDNKSADLATASVMASFLCGLSPLM